MGSSYETPAALYKMLPVSEAIEVRMLPYSFLFVTKQKQIQFWKTKLAAYKLMSTLPFSLFLTVFFPSNRSLAVL